MTTKHSVTATILALVLSWASSQAFAADEADPLFQSNDVLQATLSGPLQQFIRDKSKEDELQGTFNVLDTDGNALEFAVQFRARGNFRHDNCDYPPIRLNFKKGQTKNTLFDKQDKMKLVVHCEHYRKYSQMVLREYFAYRVLNTLTDLSFRVRLLQITYVDPEEDETSPPRYAFLIEHKDRLAHRIGLKEHPIKRADPGLHDSAHLNLTSVFQYMIGNTDFSPVAAPRGEDCCHNYVLFKGASANITAIPYDFDQSGFVDAPYANPNPRFRLGSVKQRLYRGRCINNHLLPDTLQLFQDKRAEIDALIENQPGFEKRTRSELSKYIDDFYKVIEDPKRVEKRIIENCL